MIPIPLRDENPAQRFPAVTVALIASNVLVWCFQLAHGVQLAVLDFGLIPAWFLSGTREGRIDLPGMGAVLLYQEVPQPLSVFTSMFLHGGWLHLIGNMWFLWIFGDNVEDVMGRARFLAFYLVCGIAAALAQVLVSPGSTLPMVGASGAIAGVLGAYALTHPHARVKSLLVLFVFVTTVYVPAWILLGMWFLSQFFLPLNSGVAWAAHVGGFVAGVALVRLFRRSLPPPPTRRLYE